MNELEVMRIGEAAKLAGVNVQSLRYYERTGLLPKPRRKPSGYRQYDTDAVHLVRFIKNAQELGFTLSDIAELIALREGAPKNRSKVVAMALAKVEDIGRRVRTLAAMQKTLKSLVNECETRGQSRPCPIIEAVNDGAH